MAVISTGAFVRSIRGRAGSSVFSQTKHGVTVRDHVEPTAARSEAQLAVENNMRKDGAAWTALTPEQAAAWSLAASLTTRKAKKSGKRYVPSGYQLFTEYTAKFYQISPMGTAPTLPPTGSFLGDSISVAASLGSARSTILWTASGANAPGVKTELLAQPLQGHRKPRVDDYRSLGFFAFAAGSLTTTTARSASVWACAIRFVEAATGREMGIVPIGTVTVALSLEQGGAPEANVDERKAA